MITIPGIKITEMLYQSEHTVVYRGVDDGQGKPVIIKTVPSEALTQQRLSQLEWEYAINTKLDLDGCIRVHDLIEHHGKPYLVLEDIGGASLSETINAKPLSLLEVLRIAVQVADTLSRVHTQQVIHKDINPHNIIVNREKGVVKLTDFHLAAELSRDNASLNSTEHRGGTLAYMSPEQTGRMNQAVDYRTDLYSFGVTLYELCTGQRPFKGNDAMELIHNHLARMPVPPHQVSPGQGNAEERVPEVLSAIIMKLLAKQAEDRYQTASGLKADLLECLQQWERSAQIVPFPLARQDMSDRFLIPEKLYGREGEVGTLLQAFDATVDDAAAGSRLLLVTGDAGVGKSALVQEIHTPLTGRRGHFIAGKYDQLERSRPYAAFVQAFMQLCRQLLKEPEDRLAVWREKILAAVGTNGQVLIEVIPLLAQVIGPQPAVLEISGQETQNRFNLVFQRFVRAMSAREQPLVLFLDDLQWVDLASLSLLQTLLLDETIEGLLVVGAYRDNEARIGHPLLTLVARLEEEGRAVESVSLSNLSLDAVKTMVQDTLHQTETGALSELIYAKTQGNAFFTRAFLMNLYDEGLLRFDTIQGQWQWELAAIQAKQISANVVELMIHRLGRLPVDSQQVLTLAACIGGTFDLGMLSVISEQAVEETLEHLRPVLQGGFVLAVGEEDLLASARLDITDKSTFQFSHDRVQQGAYALLDEDEVDQIHWRIGRLLLANTAEEHLAEKVFDVVNQLNLGRVFCTAPEEQIELAELNLLAGQQALSAAAYGAAYDYLKQGLALLGDSPWEEHYALALKLHETATQASYLSGDVAGVKSLFETVCRRARTHLDTIPVYEAQIEARKLHGDHLGAIRLGLEAIRPLGIDLPEEPSELDAAAAFEDITQRLSGPDAVSRLPGMEDPSKRFVLRMLARKRPGLFKKVPTLLALIAGVGVAAARQFHFKPSKPPSEADVAAMFAEIDQRLSGLDIDALVLRPAMTDPNMLVALRLLNSVSLSTLRVNPKLLVLLIVEAIKLTLEYGNTTGSAAAYTTFGHMLCEMGVFGAASQLTVITQRLMTGMDSQDLTKTYVHYPIGLTRLYLEPYKHVAPTFLDAAESALELGAFSQASTGQLLYFLTLFWSGERLDVLAEKVAATVTMIRQIKDVRVLVVIRMIQQVIENLRVPTGSPGQLQGELFDEKTDRQFFIDRHDELALLYLFSYKLVLCYLFGDVAGAMRNAKQANQLEKNISMAAIVRPNLVFYDALSCLAGYDSVEAAEQPALLEHVATNQARLEQWARAGPMNFQHKIDLVAAERARVLGEHGQAAILYQQAIQGARDHQFLQDAAIAYERAAEFYLAQGLDQFGLAYLREACTRYQRWGAGAKVAALEKHYPDLLLKTDRSTISGSPLSLSSSSSESEPGQLDLTSVLKAVQTIAGELKLDKLLAGLMKILIENAGAEAGHLLLATEGKLRIEASGTVDNEDVSVLQSLPLDGHVSVSVVNYVVRTLEPVVLEDATQAGEFTQDPHIQAHQGRSVLCLPLVNQGKLSGIVYLENNLASGVFTPARLEMVQLLSGQAAISIDHARLYEELESRVEARTRELSESETRFRSVAQSANDAMIIIDGSNKITFWNQAAANMFGRSETEVMGKSIAPLITPERHRQAYEVAIRRIRIIAEKRRRVIGDVVDLVGLKADGAEFLTEVSLSAWRSEEEIHFSAIIRDITERKQADLALRSAKEHAESAAATIELLHRVATDADQADDVKAMLRSCVDAVCNYVAWPVGHVYLHSLEQADELVSSDIWRLDEPERFAPFKALTEKTVFKSGIGLPGRVMASGSSAWIVDVRKDANFPRAKMAAAVGLGTGFALPVRVGTRIEAVLEFFTTEVIEPNPSMLAILDNIGIQLGRVIERQQDAEKLQLRLELQQIVSNISTHFMANADVDRAIIASLQDLGELMVAENALLWEYNSEHTFRFVTHEWCAAGIEPMKAILQEEPIAKNLYHETIDAGKTFFVRSISRLPPEQRQIREYFEKFGIKSVVVVPIQEKGKTIAYFSLKSPQRLQPMADHDIPLLMIFGERLRSAQQQHQTEAALMAAKEAVERASAIAETTLENMGQGIVMVDGQDKLLVFNQHALDYLGITREEVDACETLEDIYHLALKYHGEDVVNQGMYHAKKGGKASYEVTLPDGMVLEVGQNPLADGGFVRTYTDITALKKIHEDLRQAKDRAEAATEAKANFLATMSHEIRTPMTGVLGSVDLLQRTRLNDEQKHMLQTISDSGRSLLTILNDILDFSKVEAGKLDIEHVSFSLSDVLEESAETIAPNAMGKGLRLITDVDPALPAFVIGDPVRVRQILVNLGGNAVKFTEQGEVVLRAELVEDSDGDRVTVHFTVQDQGIGIPEEAQTELFQPFMQAETSTTRKYGGTGLGLSICQRLTELMGGEIGVQSTVGEGSEFHVRFSFEQSEQVLAPDGANDLSGLRVLLVIGSATEAGILQRYLVHWQAEVEVSNDMDACLERCVTAGHQGAPYDVVVLGPQWDCEEQAVMQGQISQQTGMEETRFVSLVSGQRLEARLNSGDNLYANVDPLRRSVFLSAVAIAVGRASPEVYYEEEMEDLKNPDQAPTVAQAREQGRLILVAEDNLINREVIRRQVNLLGYACEVAEDGEAALAAWRGNSYGLILTDCHMPNLDGYELTEAVRQEEASMETHVPIIAITANALRGEGERCLAAGMDDYLAKPIDLKELRAKLRQWLPED